MARPWSTLVAMADRLGTLLAVSTALALALVGVGPGVATGQKDGVFVDPDSPAGKEYALPLDTARRDAQGGGGSATAGGDGPALFGAGISPRGSSQPDGDGPGSSGADNDASSDERGGGSAAAGAAEASQAVAKAVAQSSGGLSAGWLTILIAAGVLLVGIVIGLSVRALRGPDQTL